MGDPHIVGVWVCWCGCGCLVWVFGVDVGVLVFGVLVCVVEGAH